MPTLPRPLSGRPLVASGAQVAPPSVDFTMSEVGWNRVVARAGRRPIQHGVKRARIAGIGAHVDDAEGVVVGINFLPGLAAVLGAKDSAVVDVRGLRQRMPQNTEADRVSTDDGDVRILRIDDDRLDIGHVLQAGARPGLAAVGRAIDSLAARLLAGSDVDDVGGRRSYRQRADGRHRTLSKIGCQTCPPFVLFQTPPPGVPK